MKKILLILTVACLSFTAGFSSTSSASTPAGGCLNSGPPFTPPGRAKQCARCERCVLEVGTKVGICLPVGGCT